MKWFLALMTVFSFRLYAEVNYQDVDTALKSPEGLITEVHGADKDNNLYVVVVRNPKNFLDYLQIPLMPDDQGVEQIFKTLNRHDVVKIHGQLDGWDSAAQRHISVASLEIIKKFDGGYAGYPDYQHEVKLPEDLLGKTEAIVKVHAVGDNGRILIVEYKDTNVPVMVSRPDLVKDLYRGDKILIQYSVARFPKTPTHIKLGADDSSLKILDRLVNQHGTPIDQCGVLVMFPKSPQVNFDVYAIKVDIGDDLFRFYTLINFDDMDLFLAVRQKAEDFWNLHKDTITRGRNYYLNPEAVACAKGSVNMIDPTQANPQIIINDINDLYFK